MKSRKFSRFYLGHTLAITAHLSQIAIALAYATVHIPIGVILVTIPIGILGYGLIVYHTMQSSRDLRKKAEVVRSHLRNSS